ncbi:MAG: glycosyltransferase [Phaeodactylibacter sp.]|nr:glycosyltransferase [Phaeodactylibacter sp.]MCB9274734.1 glycosyltransferase [Lewinellaceae bacterium]
MKILQLCKKFPYPLRDGESIAVVTLSRSLHRLGCKVTLLAMNTAKHYSDITHIPDELSHYEQVLAVEVDNRVKPLGAFLNLFSRESYHIARFVSPAFRRELSRLLSSQEFDIIQLETLYLAPYIPVVRQYSGGRAAMRAHNIEHEIWQRIAGNTGLLPKRWYLKYLAGKLRRYELEQFNAYDILAPITQRDLSLFRSLGYNRPAVVTPIGLDSQQYVPDYSSYRRPVSLSFIGSLDWMPNQEGLKWFLDEVWSKAHDIFPGLELHIAGRNTPSWIGQLRLPNVYVHGEVPDAGAFINQHSLMVVPLLSGSGMRAKILEGMALGKVVLATSIGLEGIGASDKREVLVADTPGQFISSITYCYEQADVLEQMGKAARSFVARHYDSLQIARRLLDAYTGLAVEACS